MTAVPARPTRACTLRMRRSVTRAAAPLAVVVEGALPEPLAVPLLTGPLGPLVMRTVVSADEPELVPEVLVVLGIVDPEDTVVGIVALRVPEPEAEAPPVERRYEGAGIADEGSFSAPLPQAIPSVFSLAAVEEPSAAAMVKRPVHVKLPGAAGEENW